MKDILLGGISLLSRLACLVTACGLSTSDSVQQWLASRRGTGPISEAIPLVELFSAEHRIGFELRSRLAVAQAWIVSQPGWFASVAERTREPVGPIMAGSPSCGFAKRAVLPSGLGSRDDSVISVQPVEFGSCDCDWGHARLVAWFKRTVRDERRARLPQARRLQEWRGLASKLHGLDGIQLCFSSVLFSLPFRVSC